MKKIITLFILSLANISFAQLTNTENYIYRKTCFSDDCIKNTETVEYFNGLGKSQQIVGIKSSPTGKDVVKKIEYDNFGRQKKDYLPVPQSGTQNGGIYLNPLTNAVNTPYGSEKIYSEKILENSPLDRVLQQKQVGNDWNIKPIQFEYGMNAAGDVKNYTATFNYATFESNISLSGVYAAGQLYKTTITDEDGNKIIEFKNGEGQMLLIRKILNATDNVDTYYVYNNYNQLAYIIPPLASVSTSIDTTILNNLCYQYKYDGRNRLVEKKLPGKGWEQMIYNKRGQVVYYRDANLKTGISGFVGDEAWTFTKYDKFGRPVYAGICRDGTPRQDIQNAVDGQSIDYEVRGGNLTMNGMSIEYGNSTYPVSIDKITSVNYYDTYPAGSPAMPSPILGQALLSQDAQNSSISTKSLSTASYVKNIEDDNWTKNYSYYDTKGRVIGTHSINHLGGYTKTETELDFAGVPQRTNTYHLRKTGEVGITVKERFVYDSQNRLLKHYHQVDSKPEELLAENSYDELSQLTNKKVGNNLQSIDYAYNIRGWMTEINKNQMSLPDLGGKLFSYKIKYNQKDGIDNPDPALFSGKNVTPKYNGNIAEVDWRAMETLGANPSLTPKRYGYAYDKLNRLSAGYYQNPNNPYSKENTESLDYDLNGNISKLYRTSVLESPSNTANVIDNLQYIYAAGDNKLTSINDNSQNPTGYEGGGNTIGYDLNGNMTKMPDKNIKAITYNFMNLPRKIEYGNGLLNIDYVYRADGTKLQKISPKSECGIIDCYTVTDITDYLDGFQYLKSTISNNGGGSVEMRSFSAKSARAMEQQAFSLEERKIPPPAKTADLRFFPTSEGFYDYTKDQYIYSYKDHLGNVRVSYGRDVNGNLEILDENDYYPFGMNHLKSGIAFFGQSNYKNYKYNGKELQESGMYDYGWRQYIPDIGRWGVIDPLAEAYTSMSAYNYGGNNPIFFIDPNGMNLGWFKDENNDMVFNENVHGQQDLVDRGIKGTYVGETHQEGSLSYASDGYVYDDSTAGGGNPIENGKTGNIEGVVMDSKEAIAQRNLNEARSRLYDAENKMFGGYAVGFTVGYSFWLYSGSLTLGYNLGSGQVRLFGTYGKKLGMPSYGLGAQLNAMHAFGKLPNGKKFTDVFKGMEGESRVVSGSYFLGGEYSESSENGKKVQFGTATTSVNLGIGYDMGTSSTQTVNLNEEWYEKNAKPQYTPVLD